MKPFGKLTQSQAKMGLLGLVIVLISWFCWLYVPLQSGYNIFVCNGWLKFYIFLSTLYLFFSGLQLRVGYLRAGVEKGLL